MSKRFVVSTPILKVTEGANGLLLLLRSFICYEVVPGLSICLSVRRAAGAPGTALSALCASHACPIISLDVLLPYCVNRT